MSTQLVLMTARATKLCGLAVVRRMAVDACLLLVRSLRVRNNACVAAAAIGRHGIAREKVVAARATARIHVVGMDR